MLWCNVIGVVQYIVLDIWDGEFDVDQVQCGGVVFGVSEYGIVFKVQIVCVGNLLCDVDGDEMLVVVLLVVGFENVVCVVGFFFVCL